MPLGRSGQIVGLLSLLSRPVHNFKVKFTQEFGPAGLAAGQLLGGHKVFKVFVVGIDLNWIGGVYAGSFGPPHLKSADNRQEFFVVYHVVAFGRIHLP
jgi:hypothetical protein